MLQVLVLNVLDAIQPANLVSGLLLNSVYPVLVITFMNLIQVFAIYPVLLVTLKTK